MEAVTPLKLVHHGQRLQLARTVQQGARCRTPAAASNPQTFQRRVGRNVCSLLLSSNELTVLEAPTRTARATIPHRPRVSRLLLVLKQNNRVLIAQYAELRNLLHNVCDFLQQTGVGSSTSGASQRAWDESAAATAAQESYSRRSRIQENAAVVANLLATQVSASQDRVGHIH
jgi:hypothetical protein